MAYATEWRPYKPVKCIVAAIKLAKKLGDKSSIGYLFRLEEVSYSVSLNADGDSFGSSQVVEIVAYGIHKITKTGYTLNMYSGDRRKFVSKETTKKFALPSWQGAVESFVQRKNRQISILENKLNRAKEAIMQAEGFKFK